MRLVLLLVLITSCSPQEELERIDRAGVNPYRNAAGSEMSWADDTASGVRCYWRYATQLTCLKVKP